MLRPRVGPLGPNRVYNPGPQLPGSMPGLPNRTRPPIGVREARESAAQAAANAAALAAQNYWKNKAKPKRPKPKTTMGPGAPGTPGATPDTQTTPPGPPGQDGTYSTAPPNQAAYESARAAAEQAWRDTQLEVGSRRNSLATQYGFRWNGGGYDLDAGGQGEYQNTVRQAGRGALDLLDSGAGRGIRFDSALRNVSSNQQAALAGLAQSLAANEGGLAAQLTSGYDTYQRTLADAERERVDSSVNAGDFNPARAPADLPPPPTAAENPASGGPTASLSWFGSTFNASDYAKWAKEARRRGVDPAKLLASRPALRRFFGK